MKELYLMRHGYSESAFFMQKDITRELIAEGREEATTIGNILHQRNIFPDYVLCSPAVRTKTTADLVAQALNYPLASIVYQEELYNAPLETLIKQVTQLEDRYQKVLLIGHNPGLTEFISHFLKEEHTILTTCGVWGLRFQGEHWSDISDALCHSIFYECPK